MSKYIVSLFAFILCSMLLTPALAAEIVDPTGTNPTNYDNTSFSKTIMPHDYERHIIPYGTNTLVDMEGITGGRWGATGDEPAAYRIASAGHTRWGWIGMLGLLGLWGRRRRARH